MLLWHTLTIDFLSFSCLKFGYLEDYKVDVIGKSLLYNPPGVIVKGKPYLYLYVLC